MSPEAESAQPTAATVDPAQPTQPIQINSARISIAPDHKPISWIKEGFTVAFVISTLVSLGVVWYDKASPSWAPSNVVLSTTAKLVERTDDQAIVRIAFKVRNLSPRLVHVLDNNVLVVGSTVERRE